MINIVMDSNNTYVFPNFFLDTYFFLSFFLSSHLLHILLKGMMDMMGRLLDCFII